MKAGQKTRISFITGQGPLITWTAFNGDKILNATTLDAQANGTPAVQFAHHGATVYPRQNFLKLRSNRRSAAWRMLKGNAAQALLDACHALLQAELPPSLAVLSPR